MAPLMIAREAEKAMSEAETKRARYVFTSSNKCHASSNRCLTCSNKEAIRIKFKLIANLVTTDTVNFVRAASGQLEAALSHWDESKKHSS